MKAHLSPEQFVDAVDGVTTDSVGRHLETCASCREDLAALSRAMRDVQQTSEVPEPSPLFWDHFSARVRAATEEVGIGAQSASWTWWRRPALAVAAIAVLATVMIVRRPPPAAVPPGPDLVQVAPAVNVVEAVEGDPAWDLVVTLASGLSSDDIHEITPPSVAASDLVESLTPAEREMFVRLVQREMGGVE